MTIRRWLISNARSPYLRYWNNFWKLQARPLIEKHNVVRDKVAPFMGIAVPSVCSVMKSESLLPFRKILYRDEYAKAEAQMEAVASPSKSTLLCLSGHHGIGKSLFLYLLLASRLRRKQPTLFQDSDGLYLFDERGVIALPKKSLPFGLEAEMVPKGTWALVDAELPAPLAAIQSLRLGLFYVMEPLPLNPLG